MQFGRQSLAEPIEVKDHCILQGRVGLLLDHAKVVTEGLFLDAAVRVLCGHELEEHSRARRAELQSLDIGQPCRRGLPGLDGSKVCGELLQERGLLRRGRERSSHLFEQVPLGVID